jgi:hypothetical protein
MACALLGSADPQPPVQTVPQHEQPTCEMREPEKTRFNQKKEPVVEVSKKLLFFRRVVDLTSRHRQTPEADRPDRRPAQTHEWQNHRGGAKKGFLPISPGIDLVPTVRKIFSKSGTNQAV